MMVMTAKVNFKKVLLILGAVVLAIIALVLLLGGGNDTEVTSATPISDNDSRVKFLTDLGWEVAASPIESSQVRIPENTTEVFDRYNDLQKSQGYDLSSYAGKNVMRYVYKVNNFPGATDPVYATILVYKNKVIGGDVTDTAPTGRIQGFKMPAGSADTTETTPTTSPTTGT